MLKILISKGKNLNIKDNKGRTPIYFAALNNHFDCVKILYENGGNVFIDDINGKKPIDVTNNINIKYYLTDIMDFPYNNPFIKKNVAKILKIREDNIIKKEMKNKNLKDSIFDKENNKKDINERNE
jgi:ankyrin repeat protein